MVALELIGSLCLERRAFFRDISLLLLELFELLLKFSQLLPSFCQTGFETAVFRSFGRLVLACVNLPLHLRDLLANLYTLLFILCTLLFILGKFLGKLLGKLLLLSLQ
jgi:hypothetical protein